MPPGMPVTPVSDPKPDTEERYTLLKGRLKEREIGGLLPVQAVPLVERLMDDLCTTQERCQQAEKNHAQARQEYLSSEQQLQPLKEDNVRLLHENNALHLELIHEAEREDEQHQELQIAANKLKTQNAELKFINAQYAQKAAAAETEAAALRERLQQVTDELASGGAGSPTPRVQMSRPIAEAVPSEQAGSDSAVPEPTDLLKIKDSQLDKLEALVNATTEQNEALDIDLRTVLQKVAARDQEIERLNQLLDGGQDYQKLSFEHVNKSNQQLVTNLNENVQFLTSQIVNLENEVLHRQGLQEEVETQNKELASAAKSLQAEREAKDAHITELQATTTSLREQFAALAEETNDARAFAQGRGKELEEQIQRLTKQNLEAGLREQSLSSHDTPSGIAALSEMQSELQRLRKSSDHINAVSDDLEASKKELVGLNSDLETARRELLRARRDKDALQEETERLRAAAAENGTAMESMRSNSRQYEEKIAEAESAAAALRSEVARLSTELLDKDTEYRNAAAARDRVELELQKLRVMEADVGTYKSAATAAREAASVQDTQNMRLRQENEQLEHKLRSKVLDEQSLLDQGRRGDQEREALQQSQSKLKSENGELRSQCDELREERNNLSTLYAQVKEQMLLLQRERASATSSDVESEGRLRERISELEGAVLRANEETAEARQRAETSRSTSQQLATESTVLAKTVSDLRQGRADAQREVDRLTAKEESIERSLAAQTAEAGRAQAQCKERLQEIEQMRVLFAQLDATRAELVDKLERERARADRCEANLRAAATQHDAQRAELKQRDEDLERATTALRKLDAERDSVAHELDSAAENRATLQQAYEQSEARQLEAEKSQADIEAKLQATIAQRDSMSAEASGLRQAFEQAQAGRAALQEELDLKTQEIVALSEDLSNVTAENQAINAELMDVVSSRDQCREALGAMEVRLGHAESGVQMKDTEHQELLSAYRTLVSSNAQLLEAVQAADTEAEQMRAAAVALQGELANARGAVAERDSTRDAADEQMMAFRKQSEEYTDMSRKLRDELAEAKQARIAAEQVRAPAAAVAGGYASHNSRACLVTGDGRSSQPSHGRRCRQHSGSPPEHHSCSLCANSRSQPAPLAVAAQAGGAGAADFRGVLREGTRGEEHRRHAVPPGAAAGQG